MHHILGGPFFFYPVTHWNEKRGSQGGVVIGDKYSSKIAKLTLYIHLNPNGGNCHESEAKPTIIFCLHMTETWYFTLEETNLILGTWTNNQ